MSNSVFGATGVFGGPSLFGAAELDPMFAASNPAPPSVFAASNPKVVGRVGRGKGKTRDAKDEFARKAALAWKAGRLSDARIHMKSYEKQAASTRNGFLRRALDHIPARLKGASNAKARFEAWVKQNYGKKLGAQTVIRDVDVDGGAVTITTSTVRPKKYSKRYKGRKPKAAKVIKAASQVAPPKQLHPGLDHKMVIRSRQSRSGGSMVARMRLGGPRVAGLLSLPPALRAARMSRMAGPVHRLRARRKAGMQRLPFRQALPKLAHLPRQEYREKRNQLLVDRTVEQVIERLRQDPNFINMSYEEKVAEAVPIANAADAELASVESEIGVAPPHPVEETEAIDEIMEETATASDWESEFSDEFPPLDDESFDLDFDAEMMADDEFSGVFGAFGAAEDVATRAEAAARAAVDAIEADVAATEATAEAAVEEAEEGSSTNMLLVGGGLIAAYFVAKHFGIIR